MAVCGWNIHSGKVISGIIRFLFSCATNTLITANLITCLPVPVGQELRYCLAEGLTRLPSNYQLACVSTWRLKWCATCVQASLHCGPDSFPCDYRTECFRTYFAPLPAVQPEASVLRIAYNFLLHGLFHRQFRTQLCH